MTLRSRGP